MAYEPTNWKSGDVVTSAKLNKMEQGIANAGGTAFIVSLTLDEETGEITTNKTASEIMQAYQKGVVIFSEDASTGTKNLLVYASYLEGNGYEFGIPLIAPLSMSPNPFLILTAESADSYPSYSQVP